MNVESAEAELAYTYAWWLTGNEHAARTAVLAAVDRPDVPGADPTLRLEILLRRVRAAAVTAPTMCPASELALLHDAIGVGLDSAAGLAMIDAREARTELAHGRLEALGPDAEFEITEPQRLGGLAVGNPADVAAARQNAKLAQLREAIMKGRDELVDVSRIDIPFDLLDTIAKRGTGQVVGEPMDPSWFAAIEPAARDGNVGAGPDGGDAIAGGDTVDPGPDGGPDGKAGPVDAGLDDNASPVDASAADEPVDFDALPALDAVPDPGSRATGGTDPDADNGTDADADNGTDADADNGTDADADSGVGSPRAVPGNNRHDRAIGHSEEIDLSEQVRAPEGAGSGGRRVRSVLVVLAIAAGALVISMFGGAEEAAEQPDDVASQGPVAPDPETDGPATDAPVVEDAATDGPAVGDPAVEDPAVEDPAVEGTAGDQLPVPGDDGTQTDENVAFTVARAGVAVGIGGDPDFDNPVASPFDPVSITVEYSGAQQNDALIADWTVDGQPFDTERADLSPLLDVSRFTKSVPEAGWPVGQHTLILILERTGEVVGEALFQVQP